MVVRDSASAIVIGGGLLGLLSARELVSAGLKVRLVEMGHIGRASSWAGGGILSPLYPWRYDDPITELARWSQARYAELAARLHAESGIDPEWTQSGMLLLDTSDRGAAQTWARRFGYRLETLTEEALRECEPALGVAGGALWMPEVAQVRNPRLVQSARAALLKQGVVIEEQCEVSGLSVRAGRVTGVHTARGEMTAEVVVVAAGAWSRQLLAGLDIHPEIRPVRGQMLLFKGVPDMVTRIILGERHYVIPRRDGRVLVGSTMEEAGFDDSTTATARAELEAAAFRLVPGLRDFAVERHWAGLRPGSPTGVPYIGEHPQVAGLFLNSGHFRNGVVMAPASARLLVDLVVGRGPIVDPAPYALKG